MFAHYAETFLPAVLPRGLCYNFALIVIKNLHCYDHVNIHVVYHDYFLV